MNVLVEQTSPRQVLKVLDNLPREVNNIYDNIFGRINNLRMAPEIRKFIVVVAYVRRPLHVAALEQACAVQPEDTELDELNVSDSGHLASLCAGLIDIDAAGFVRLAHETIGDYIAQHYQNIFTDPESLQPEICLTFLQFSSFALGSTSQTNVYDEV